MLDSISVGNLSLVSAISILLSVECSSCLSQFYSDKYLCCFGGLKVIHTDRITHVCNSSVLFQAKDWSAAYAERNLYIDKCCLLREMVNVYAGFSFFFFLIFGG